MTLLDALTKAARIAKRGNTLPILNNVLLEPDENGITVTATDLEMRYQATVEGLTITGEKIGTDTVKMSIYLENRIIS